MFRPYTLVPVGIRVLAGGARCSPLETGLGFLPIAIAAGAGTHAGSKLARRVGVRASVALAFALAGVGTLLLSCIDGAAGMLSGLNTTGHEVGGALGVAAVTTIASQAIDTAGAAPGGAALASGLGDAFLAAAAIAGVGLLLALVLLPAASQFVPRLRDAPQPVGIH